MSIQDKLLYTKEHEWILIEGNKAKIGITYYAQAHLGDITYIEPPEVGKEVKRSDVLTTIESVKAASEVYAPMSGKVVEVNGNLDSSPELINKAPYDNGWIARIEIKDEAEKNNLMDSNKYKEYLKSIKE